MQANQSYTLTIKDLFAMSGGAICGTESEVIILDGETEVDRVRFCGKAGPGGSGYCLSFTGKPGLTAKIASGPGSITMTSVPGLCVREAKAPDEDRRTTKDCSNRFDGMGPLIGTFPGVSRL